MKVFAVFQSYESTNSYLIGAKKGQKDAILIDPVKPDISLLKLIEDNNYYIRHILLTHSDPGSNRGIMTLLRIYDSQIHSVKPIVCGVQTKRITEETVLDIEGIKVQAIPVPGHYDSSVIYKIGNMLFTGDTIKAGYTGETSELNQFREMTDFIKKKIFTLKGEYLIFPRYGAPSTLTAEKKSNLLIKS